MIRWELGKLGWVIWIIGIKEGDRVRIGKIVMYNLDHWDKKKVIGWELGKLGCKIWIIGIKECDRVGIGKIGMYNLDHWDKRR